MWGSKASTRSSGTRRHRLSALGLLVSLLLILGQASIVVASADTSRDRSDGSVSDTTVVTDGGSAGGGTARSTGTDQGPAVPTHAAQAAPVRAPATDIVISGHEGEQASPPGTPSGTYTSGNVSTYREGDSIHFRFTLTNSGAATGGTLQLTWTKDGGPQCVGDFFTNAFSLGAIENVSGASPTVTPGSVTSVGGDWSVTLTVAFAAQGTARVNYFLTLSKTAGACSGSSQHSQFGSTTGDVKDPGKLTLPVPANAIIDLPDITVTKTIDRDGDGTFESTASAGEYCFKLDGGSCVATDAQGKVVFQAVTPDGDHSISEQQLLTNQGTYVFDSIDPSSTNCTPGAGNTGVANIAAETVGGTPVKNATCIFRNKATAALSIAKTGPATVAANGNISWTVTVTNNGNAPASNVDVTDTLPAGFTFVSSSPAGCTGTTVVSCTIAGPIAGGGGTGSVAITAKAPNTCGPFTNDANFTGAATPGATATGDVIGCAAALSIAKTGPATVAANGNISWTVTVTNNGNAPASNVDVTDTLPAGFTFVSSSPAGCTGTTVVSCTIAGPIAGGGGTGSVAITAKAPNTCGPFTNDANFTRAVTPGATATGNVIGCTTGSTPSSGLQIDKTGPARAHVGDTITYGFAVNLLPNSPPVTGVVISDPICDPGTLGAPTMTGGNQDTVLEQGETWRYSCTRLVRPTDPDPLPNTAAVTGTGQNGSPVSASDSHLVDIIHPDIDLVKTADPTSGSPGAVITYRYAVTNSGDVDLFNVSVDDNILGHICDFAVLHAKDTVICIGTYRIPKNANIQITNIAIAGATDPLGLKVKAQDDATIDVVLGATVTPTKTPPSGVAFTGSSAVLPLSGLALVLLLLGSGMLWASRNRDKRARGADEA